MLNRVWFLLDKDPQFIFYVTNSAWELVQAEMKSMSLSNQLKIPVEDINLHWLTTFLLVQIDRVYKQEVSFLCSLLQACIDNHDNIIDNPNLNKANENLLFYDNMINLIELEEQTLPKRNGAFISVISPALLCYAQNERLNLFKKIISHYAFSSNISKRSVESFY